MCGNGLFSFYCLVSGQWCFYISIFKMVDGFRRQKFLKESILFWIPPLMICIKPVLSIPVWDGFWSRLHQLDSSGSPSALSGARLVANNVCYILFLGVVLKHLLAQILHPTAILIYILSSSEFNSLIVETSSILLLMYLYDLLLAEFILIQQTLLSLKF